MWHGESRQRPRPIEKSSRGSRALRLVVLACFLVVFSLLLREQYARYMLDRDSAYKLAEDFKNDVCEKSCDVFERIVESDINKEEQKHYEFFWCGKTGNNDLLVTVWDNGIFVDYYYWWGNAKVC